MDFKLQSLLIVNILKRRCFKSCHNFQWSGMESIAGIYYCSQLGLYIVVQFLHHQMYVGFRPENKNNNKHMRDFSLHLMFSELTGLIWFAGDAPLVIARGGFSGLFPGFSLTAFNLALITSVPDVVLWCDVQLTKDGAGICFPELLLNNNSDIEEVFAKKDRTYLVNGVSTSGWFTVDYTLNDLANVFGECNCLNLFPLYC